jgi:hypothetical protein
MDLGIIVLARRHGKIAESDIVTRPLFRAIDPYNAVELAGTGNIVHVYIVPAMWSSAYNIRAAWRHAPEQPCVVTSTYPVVHPSHVRLDENRSQILLDVSVVQCDIPGIANTASSAVRGLPMDVTVNSQCSGYLIYESIRKCTYPIQDLKYSPFFMTCCVEGYRLMPSMVTFSIQSITPGY